MRKTSDKQAIDNIGRYTEMNRSGGDKNSQGELTALGKKRRFDMMRNVLDRDDEENLETQQKRRKTEDKKEEKVPVVHK
jgi:hypothetical protein